MALLVEVLARDIVGALYVTNLFDGAEACVGKAFKKDHDLPGNAPH